MPIEKTEHASQFALAALMRGVGDFAHRVAPADTPAQALQYFAEKHLRRLVSLPAAASALRLAVESFEPRSPGARLLDSAWRFASDVGPTKSFRPHRMRSPLSTIFAFKDGNGAVLPLTRLELDEGIFPTAQTTAPTDRPLDHLLEQFAQALSELQAADTGALVQSLAAALEAFAWSVPAEGYDDVSIFEVARNAGAIAAALAAEQPPETVRTDYAKAPLLLAVGDLGGIQRFLYTVVASKAARMLRGRSLALQLIADAIANRILERFALPVSNLLYSGGGKLWLLMPAAAREELLRLGEQIDLELNQRFASRLSFGLGCAVIPASELSAGVSGLWERAVENLAQGRRRRFAQLMRAGYEQLFEPFGEGSEACRVCGVLSGDLQPLSPAYDEDTRLACAQCREFVELGSAATRARLVI